MQNFSLKHLIALCILVRLILFIAIQPWQVQVVESKILVNDAVGYHKIALAILNDEDPGILGVRRTPGYPMFLAAIYSVFGVNPWIVLLIQIGISAVTVNLIYVIAKHWFGASSAAVAGIFYSLEPHAAFSANSLLTDTFFTMLIVASVSLLIFTIEKPRPSRFLLIGLLLGFATLLRPVGLYFALFIIPVVIFFARYNVSRLLASMCVMIISLALVLSPLLVKNYKEYGVVAMTDKGGQHLIEWVAPYVEITISDKTIDESRRDFRRLAINAGAYDTENPFLRSKVEQEISTSFLRQHFGAFFIASAKGVRNSFLNLETRRIADLLGFDNTQHGADWNDTSVSLLENINRFFVNKSKAELVIGAVVAIILLVTYVASIVGALHAVANKRYFPVFLAVSVAVFFCAFIGPIGVSRYKLPFMPFYLILAGYGFTRIQSGISRRIGSET